jgi:hypothetical protein
MTPEAVRRVLLGAVLLIAMCLTCGCGPTGWCRIESIEHYPGTTRLYPGQGGLVDVYEPAHSWARVRGKDRRGRVCTGDEYLPGPNNWQAGDYVYRGGRRPQTAEDMLGPNLEGR